MTPTEISSRIRRRLDPAASGEAEMGAPDESSQDFARLRAQLRLLRQDCRKIGELPPRPPTWRGSLGAFLVSIVHRAMFWYTPTIQYAFSGVSETLEQMFSVLLLRIQAAEAKLSTEARERETRLRHELEARFTELSARIDSGEKDAQDLRQNLQAVRRDVLGQSLLVGRAGFSLQQGLQPLSPPPSLYLDPLYVSFEDRFRGARADVQEALKMYLPFLQGLKSPLQDEASSTMILDIGCGRGEWLELLRAENFQARGIDINALMIEECRQQSIEGGPLDVEQADALEYLARQPDASLAAITAFHVVEHLPFEKLIRLLDEVARVLRSGGVAIFETPNPDNILVGARNFYHDPTHRNPIPNATLRFLVESRGLNQVEVLPLHPCDPVNLVPNPEGSELIRKFNDFFYGPQDYAVIGRKV